MAMSRAALAEWRSVPQPPSGATARPCRVNLMPDWPAGEEAKQRIHCCVCVAAGARLIGAPDWRRQPRHLTLVPGVQELGEGGGVVDAACSLGAQAEQQEVGGHADRVPGDVGVGLCGVGGQEAGVGFGAARTMGSTAGGKPRHELPPSLLSPSLTAQRLR